jgi:hypothetical protein
MPGKHSRNKGAAYEREIADFLFARDDLKETVAIVRMETLLALFKQLGWADG